MTPDQIARLVGSPVTSVRAVGGGDICQAARAELADGRRMFVKHRPGAPAGFFAAEARGLHRLKGVIGGACVPAVVAYDTEHLVLDWIAPGPPTAEAAERFGRALATTHRSGAEVFGSAEGDGWIGTLPLPGGPWPDWPTMWVEGRVLPYLKNAVDAGRISASDAYDVEQLLTHVAKIVGAAEPPALIHGDLWAGNVVWGADGVAHLVDPAAHGGHRETDIAMLTLFGFPHLNRVIAAYHEVWPLAGGWRDRVALHQLHPVLVHAVLFGGSYGAQAGRLARSLR